MRILALDSLRGLAALAVAIYHSILVFPELDQWLLPDAATSGATALLLVIAPPSLLWAGREAVLLFFVLSGFVLSLALEPRPGADRPGWAAFATKRMVRLLLPCTVVALLLAVLVPLVAPQPRAELSAWFNDAWAEPVTPALVAGHAMLVLNEYVLNSPMWTLHYELRISLILPLLVLLAALGSHVLLAAAAGAVLGCLVEMKFIGTGVLTTFLFLPHFAFGTILARHREVIAARIRSLGPVQKMALWVICYLLLQLAGLMPGGALVSDMVAGTGAALLLALVLASARVQRVLLVRPLPWLGAISYSFYLVHVPVLLTLVHLAPPPVPAWLPAVAAPLLAIPLAWLLYRTVERPAMRLGRHLGGWVEARSRRPGVVGVSR
ncbi:MAG TPA: acyltransferase [Falsiroseomonas sp.]|jgi:peptidoglycan/LPS O-acetylase OafA/YrhL|nr:acyltransferase [Falsiroseomonas sp.]